MASSPFMLPAQYRDELQCDELWPSTNSTPDMDQLTSPAWERPAELPSKTPLPAVTPIAAEIKFLARQCAITEFTRTTDDLYKTILEEATTVMTAQAEILDAKWEEHQRIVSEYDEYTNKLLIATAKLEGLNADSKLANITQDHTHLNPEHTSTNAQTAREEKVFQMNVQRTLKQLSALERRMGTAITTIRNEYHTIVHVLNTAGIGQYVTDLDSFFAPMDETLQAYTFRTTQPDECTYLPTTTPPALVNGEHPNQHNGIPALPANQANTSEALTTFPALPTPDEDHTSTKNTDKDTDTTAAEPLRTTAWLLTLFPFRTKPKPGYQPSALPIDTTFGKHYRALQR